MKQNECELDNNKRANSREAEMLNPSMAPSIVQIEKQFFNRSCELKQCL